MTKPFIRIHNIETNKIIDREMNDNEFAQWQTNQAQIEAETQAEAEAATKKLVALDKLKALGLNQSDLTALGL